MAESLSLAYITRVEVPSHAAQSIQIDSMARAFHEALGVRFQLWCSGSPTGSEPYRRVRLPFNSCGFFRYAAACMAAAGRVTTDRYTVVYTRDIAVAWTAVMLGGRAVYEVHKEPIGRLAKWFMRNLANSGRFRLVAISRALGSYYASRYSIPKSRLLVAHSGAWPEEYYPLRLVSKQELRRQLGLPASALLVVHTGSLYKGGAELFGHVASYDPDLIIFVHVGGSEKDCTEWTAYYVAKGVLNIRFIPYCSHDKMKLFQCAADLLFYVTTRNSPIWWCTSPLKLFEYMASGTPMLSSCIGSLSEVLNSDNSYSFNPAEPDEIAQAFAAFRDDAERAMLKAQMALQEVEALYSWPHRVGKILAFCNDKTFSGW